MDIAIVKGDGRTHRCVVARPDGSTAQFAVHDYGAALPHDLVHYVVERDRELAFGFWGLLASGARFESVAAFGARDKRAVPPPHDPLVAAHVDELMEAEHLAVDAATMRNLAGPIAELNQRWQATPVGEAFRLTWGG